MRPETNTEKQIISPELIARAKAGDQAAYTELYERTYPALYRTICAMTRDEDTAWDILQETYLRAFQSLDRLDANEAFVSWLRRIAVNETTRRMSRRMPANFSELSGAEEDDMPEIPDLRPESQPELVIDQQETSRLVQEIMADLPEQQRLIVGMRYYEDLSVKEIADLLRLAPGTVKAHLHSGRKNIETRVRELERQGVKLYGLSPIAFLVALLRRMEPSERVGRAALAQTLTKAGVSAGAKAAGAAGTAGAGKTITAMTAGQAMRHGLGAKVAAGLLSVAVIGGGIWGGSKLLNSEQPAVPIQPTETVEVVLQNPSTTENAAPDTTSIAPLAETNPVETTEPTVTEPAPTEPSEAPLPEKLSGNCGDDLTWRFDPDTGTLHIEGSGDMVDYCNYEEHDNNKSEWDALNSRIRMIELPEGLTGIGGSAFENCTALTNVTIPASVKTIGNSAFYGCASLTNVTIPAGVAEIGYNVFGSCGALTAIDVASGNPRYTSLDGVLFDKQWGENELTLLQYPGGKKDTSYTMPENAAHIDFPAFSNSYLTSITLSENFGDISNMISYMFDDCTAITELHVASGNSVCSSIDGVLFDKDQTELIYYPAARRNETYTVPNGVQYIGENSFMECAALKHISIPDSVTDIGDGAFWGNSSLENVTIPGSVNRVGDYAFWGNSSLENVTIPGSVDRVGKHAFECCTALKRVEFQEGVTEIGFGAFNECTALTEVVIPASVTRLGSEGGFYDFNGCASLTNIQVAPGNQNFSSVDGVLFDKNQETLYRYPPRKQGASYVIPDGVKMIDVRAFEGCAFLTDVTIPDSVTYIGVLAFTDCNMLTHVTIPAGVTTIDDNAFQNCTALTEVTIPASVTEIGEYSFGYSDIQWPYNFESAQAASKVEGFTMYGEAGSEAQRYAEENGFPFKAV